ncbi:CASP-like protein 2D1 [Phoenix dactylifera]|uniref:CASP-like protein n=1 Tax=Phoenix dactylifera TaxID=42345 RepID=A0A8B7CXT1_PHODC|nr:CASP-like protein 2D1 [Phoenix dactylifera]
MRNGADTTLSSSNDHHQLLRFLDFFLRLSVIPLSVASLWVMASNKQTNDAYGKVEFSNLSGLRYLVGINAISTGYAIASVLLLCLRCFNSDWYLFISDQVMAYLMVTSGSAVAEVLYLAHEGDRKVSWSEVCSYYGMFCSKIKVSLALHFVALVCFIVLSLISAYRVFSKFEAPSLLSEEVGEQE